LEASSKESKILLDVTYKNMMRSDPLVTRSYTYVIDFEGKVLGHRPEYDQKFFSNLTNATMNLNKKLLHSTIFGSIKLIKI
jgi:GTP-sensing pleiotropic transcriptional regulator CodY